MKTKMRAWAAALCLLALLVVVGFSTEGARGRNHGFQSYTATAFVVGATGATFTNGAARKYVSIGTSGTGGTTTVMVGSPSLISSPDTLTINAGQSWSGYFHDGLDSLRILTVSTSGTVNVAVNQ